MCVIKGVFSRKKMAYDIYSWNLRSCCLWNITGSTSYISISFSSSSSSSFPSFSPSCCCFSSPTPSYPFWTVSLFSPQPSGRNKQLLADILSVLAMTVDEEKGCLLFRLQGSQEAIASFGHPYIRRLCSQLPDEWTKEGEREERWANWRSKIVNERKRGSKTLLIGLPLQHWLCMWLIHVHNSMY